MTPIIKGLGTDKWGNAYTAFVKCGHVLKVYIWQKHAC